MTCTRCGSDVFSRSRRRGIGDHIRAALGQWPYRCDGCDLRFWAGGRRASGTRESSKLRVGSETVDRLNIHADPGTNFRAFAEHAAKNQPAPGGPEMAFRTHEEKPQAKIVLQADSHEQLNHLLLALNRAVMSYQPEVQGQREPETAKAKR